MMIVTNSPRRRGSRRTIVATAAIALSIAVLGAACSSDDEGTAAQPSPTSPAPDAAPAAPLSDDREVAVQGEERSYRVVTPPGDTGDGGDTELPVIVAIHDAGNTIDGMAQVTQLQRAAVQHDFAVVFPAAAEEAERTWNAGFCCGAGPSVGLDDMAFLDAVVDEVADDEQVDADRIYLAGVSNGAVMAYQYACERAERVAGVGSVAGTMDPESCQPAEPVSVLEIHGTNDDVVPFDGGEMPDFVQATLPAISAEALVGHWAEANSCSEEPTTSADDPVTRTTWEQCEADATVELIAIEGAGHTWYASEFGPVDGAVDATDEILRFFGLAG